jgi:hypothetical protein
MRAASGAPCLRGRGSPAPREDVAGPRARSLAALVLLLIGLACVPVALGCSGEEEQVDGETTSSSIGGDGSQSGDIEGAVGEALEVGTALVTVKALHSTFQPATPVQRLSEQTPTAPEAGESFYQAQVRVENRETDPIRVDPNHFACAIGDTVASIEPTMSGPLPRSLLKNTSLDLLLTFKGPAGYEPILLYNPPWYRGTVRVSPQVVGETTTTS